MPRAVTVEWFYATNEPHCNLTVGCVRHRAVHWDGQHTGSTVLCWASAERLEAACQTPGEEGIQVDSQEEKWPPEPSTSSWSSQTPAVSVAFCKYHVVKYISWYRSLRVASEGKYTCLQGACLPLGAASAMFSYYTTKANKTNVNVYRNLIF